MKEMKSEKKPKREKCKVLVKPMVCRAKKDKIPPVQLDKTKKIMNARYLRSGNAPILATSGLQCKAQIYHTMLLIG